MKPSAPSAVFISHTHADTGIAHGVLNMLNNIFPGKNMQIFCTSAEENGLAVGDKIVPQIRRRLRSTSIVLGLLTRNSLLSSWVITEMGVGWGLGKVVLPIQFDLRPDELPGPFSAIKAGDGRNQADWSDIFNTIHNKIKWLLPSEDVVERATSNFVSDLPARRSLAQPDLEIVKLILSERGCKGDAQVRLLEGPVQDKGMMEPRRSNDSQFLITDYKQLCDMYDDALSERGLYAIPYKEVTGVLSSQITGNKVVTKDVPIKVLPDRFVLESLSVSHKLFQVQAYAQMVRSKRVDSDKPVSRLTDIKYPDNESACLIIQKAKYSDQVQSNLVLNWGGSRDGWAGHTGLQRPLGFRESKHTDLLEMMHSHARWDKKLPPFSQCGFMANTIGVSVILFCRVGSELVPIINDRPPSTKAIFQHGWTVTASFALGFHDDPSDRKSSDEAKWLSELVEPWLLDAIEKKAKIPREKVAWLAPVALCREFQRGGKPQFFYVGCVEDVLAIDKVREGLAKVKDCNRVHPVISTSDLQDLLDQDDHRDSSYTSEFIANWYFAKHRFIDKLRTQ